MFQHISMVGTDRANNSVKEKAMEYKMMLKLEMSGMEMNDVR